jgi:hypothetical protein
MEALKPITERPLWTMTAVDLQNLEMTLTLEEWHRQRDRDDDTNVVVLHEPDLLLAS